MTAVRPRAAVLLVLGTVAPLAVGAQDARVAVNLVTTSEVVIARPAAAVWPHILNPESWKQGLRLVHRSGPHGAAGEVFAAVAAATPDIPAYFVENAEVIPGKRRVIKLYTPDGALIGFAAFVLTEGGGATTVRYDVFTETVLTAAERLRSIPAERAASARAERDAALRRFDAELQALKRLVEGR